MKRKNFSGAQPTCSKCGVILNETNSITADINHGNYICRSCDAQIRIERRIKLKAETILAYGGECECCGCTVPEFLTIDHINNNGASHRKEVGNHIYPWLKRNGFPKDNFRLLCFNCNCARQFSGICPHQKLSK